MDEHSNVEEDKPRTRVVPNAFCVQVLSVITEPAVRKAEAVPMGSQMCVLGKEEPAGFSESLQVVSRVKI